MDLDIVFRIEIKWDVMIGVGIDRDIFNDEILFPSRFRSTREDSCATVCGKSLPKDFRALMES